MSWFSELFGGGSQSSSDSNRSNHSDSGSGSDSDGKRCAKDGTCFQNATDGRHVVITHEDGSPPAVGHIPSGPRASTNGDDD
jgi:hypothetical protein